MKTINMKKYSFTLLLLTTTVAVFAKDVIIQHDAHEHGVAEMNIVWEKEDLNIELLSPAFNITGFENKAANHEQEEAIAKIEKKLNLPSELFSFKDDACKVLKAEIKSPFEEHTDHEKHEEKGHDEHAMHDNHDDHDEHESSTHSEYEISYQFSCPNSKPELTIAAVNVFKHFPNMEKIIVQWLSATQQSSAILTKKSNTITLK